MIGAADSGLAAPTCDSECRSHTECEKLYVGLRLHRHLIATLTILIVNTRMELLLAELILVTFAARDNVRFGILREPTVIRMRGGDNPLLAIACIELRPILLLLVATILLRTGILQEPACDEDMHLGLAFIFTS